MKTGVLPFVKIRQNIIKMYQRGDERFNVTFNFISFKLDNFNHVCKNVVL